MYKKTGLIIGLAAFFVMFLADIISTFMLGDLKHYLEANLAYPYIGMTGIILLNLLMMFLVYYFYNKTTNPFKRFILINFLVLIALLRFPVVYNNILIALNPPSLAQAMSITTAEKTAAMAEVGLMVLVPYLLSIFSFMLFEFDHKVFLKPKE